VAQVVERIDLLARVVFKFPLCAKLCTGASTGNRNPEVDRKMKEMAGPSAMRVWTSGVITDRGEVQTAVNAVEAGYFFLPRGDRST